MAKKEIVKSESSELALPDFLPQGGDVRGKETITRDDILLPRLALAQGLSPELIENDPRYIPELKLGDMFNTVTKEVYGKGPMEFTIIRSEKTRAVEFHPRETGGGVKDPNVPLTDPRCHFGADGSKPVATKFMEYVALLLPKKELVMLSFKSKGLRAARAFNLLLTRNPQASFAGKYTIKVGMDKNNAGQWATYIIRISETEDDCTSIPGFVSKDVYETASRIFDSMKGQSIAAPTDNTPDTADPDADGDAVEM